MSLEPILGNSWIIIKEHCKNNSWTVPEILQGKTSGSIADWWRIDGSHQVATGQVTTWPKVSTCSCNSVYLNLIAAVKILNIRTPKTFAVITLKLKKMALPKSNAPKRCSRNCKQCRPWSDSSSRSSQIWVCTVCPDLSVQKLRNITGNCCSNRNRCIKIAVTYPQ